MCVCVCVFNVNPLQFTRIGFRAMRIHGVSMVYFRFTHLLGRPQYAGEVSVLCVKELDVRVNVCVIVLKCKCTVCGMVMKGREKVNTECRYVAYFVDKHQGDHLA